MTDEPDVLCKACGTQHGTLDDYDEGDTLECGCGCEYCFEYDPDARYHDRLKMRNVPHWDTSPPEPEEILEVDADAGTVLWKISDGHRRRDYIADVHFEVTADE